LVYDTFHLSGTALQAGKQHFLIEERKERNRQKFNLPEYFSPIFQSFGNTVTQFRGMAKKQTPIQFD
jgi:hypothetical protein